MGVFDRLLDLLFPPRESELLVREAEADALARQVSPVELPLRGARATALLPYRGLAQATVIEAKYHDSAKAHALLGGVLGEYLLELCADEGAFDTRFALVPLPLSAARRAKRGYNQAERICEAAIGRLDGACSLMPHALRRLRDTPPQTKLPGNARRENLRGAFEAAPGLDSSYTYIVVDDVITTGATMEAAVEALQSAGARVIVVALAR